MNENFYSDSCGNIKHIMMTSTTSNNNNGSNKLQVLSNIAVTQNNGNLLRIRHTSTSTQTEMTFSLFLPSTYGTLLRSKGQSIPALYWLSEFTVCCLCILWVLGSILPILTSHLHLYIILQAD